MEIFWDNVDVWFPGGIAGGKGNKHKYGCLYIYSLGQRAYGIDWGTYLSIKQGGGKGDGKETGHTDVWYSSYDHW